MNANKVSILESGQPMPSDHAYRKLVSKGITLLRAGERPADVERAIRIDAFHLIPKHTTNRREHSSDLALQAIVDAGATTSICVEP